MQCRHPEVHFVRKTFRVNFDHDPTGHTCVLIFKCLRCGAYSGFPDYNFELARNNNLYFQENLSEIYEKHNEDGPDSILLAPVITIEGAHED